MSVKVKEKLYYLRNFMQENNQLHDGWLQSITDGIARINELEKQVEELENQVPAKKRGGYEVSDQVMDEVVSGVGL